MSDHIEPFRIAATDEQLGDLKQRLRNTRWPEPECVDDWTQGIPLSYTQELCQYWLEQYDWRARGAAQSLSAVPDHDRRTGDSFHSRSLTAS